MQCLNPYTTAGHAFGCGQCMPCRYNRRRIWATRIMLEAAQNKDNAFVTCTYADEARRYSLVPGDMRDFIKRLRERYARRHDRKFRFFGVGEYGDQNEGAHFHFALFNFPTCIYRRSQFARFGGERCCHWCDMVRDAWGHGNVFLGEVENDSAGYISGYVTKKLDATNEKLGNRHPEFPRMSLKPGIGANAMFDVAHTLLNYQNSLDTMTDVPGELRIGPRKVPLGRYLKKRLRLAVGRDAKAPPEALQEVAAQMLPLRLAAREDDVNPSFKARLIAMGEGKREKARARRQIFSKPRRL